MVDKICLKCGKKPESEYDFYCECGSNKFAGNKKHYDAITENKSLFEDIMTDTSKGGY